MPKKVSQPRRSSSAKKSVKKISKAKPSAQKQKKASPPCKIHGNKQKKLDIFDHFAKNNKYAKHGFSTRAIHAGNEPEPVWGGVAPMLDLSTTFAQPSPGECALFDYQRCGNPTRLAFEKNLASLEHGKYAFAASSGCGATLQIMSMLSSGDHVLCVDDVYGGT